MSERPWMKFYTADWRSDPRLRMCSLAARGLWMEMLAVMHEAAPYGHLLVEGVAPDVRQIAALVGAPLDQVSALLAELESMGVFSRTRKGVVYSRRMVRDEKKAEIGRKSANRRHGQGAENKAEKPVPNGSPTGKPHAYIPETRDQSLEYGGGGTRATPDEVLSLIGVDLSKSRNPTAWFDGAITARLDAWRALGLDDGEIRLILGKVAAAKQGGPPSTIAYFDPAMQRAAGEKKRPTLTPIDGGRNEQRTDNADRLQRIIRAAAEGSSRQDWG